MASTDWQPLSESLTEDVVRRGATSGVTPPNGGGSYCFGMRSVGTTAGVLAMQCKVQNFSPTPAAKGGGRITGAIRRTQIGSADGFSPFLFFCAADASVQGNAYLLGLSNEGASHIQLRKGPISLGMPAVSLIDPDVAPNVMMRSTNAFPNDIWHHLRLDVIVQGTGDVILQVYRNDLDTHGIGSPIWQAVPGMEGPFSGFAGYVDDALGVNTGSVPLTAGYMGFGARFENSNRAVYFDSITCERQL